MSPKRSAFSLVELIVVLALAAILLGLILPAVHSAQFGAGKQQTINNLKNLAIACHNCNDTYGKLPPAFDKFGGLDFPASVHMHLLPYLEQNALYNAFRQNKGKEEVVKVRIPFFTSSDDPSGGKDTVGIQNFAGNLAGIMITTFTGVMLTLTKGSFLIPLAAAGALCVVGALSYLFVVGKVEPLPPLQAR